MSAKVKGCGCLALALLAVAMVWVLIGVGAPEATNFPRPFNSAAWKSEAWSPGNDVGDGSKRCGMILDLSWRVGVVGRTEAEILSLLGKADTEEGGLPHYYMLCPSFLDIYVLELKWKNGRVSSAIVRDT